MRSSRVGLSLLLAGLLLLAVSLATPAQDHPQAAGTSEAVAAAQEASTRGGSATPGSPDSSPLCSGFSTEAVKEPDLGPLFAGLSAGASLGGADQPPVLFRHAGTDACRASRAAQAAAGRLLFQGTSRASDNIDAVSYTITMGVDFEAESMSARCDVRVRSLEAGLTQFTLDLAGLTVTGVMEDFTAAVVFAHEGAELQITPSTPMALDEERVYSITYYGVPENGLFFSGQNQGTCFSFSEPEDARFWFPCRDIPSDKADWYRGHITAPTGKLVASNGDLEGTQDNGDGTTTFDYFHDYPISTYLISVAISPYATFEQSASGGVDLTHYVYPVQLDDAIYDWANTPAMIDFYSATYEPYPFPTYGMACAPLGGAMEHQTMTTMDPGLIDGQRGGESVVAHELSHMWWGDMITCADWPNIWLNEGFASYFDALFTEHFYGADSFRAQMISSRLSYLYWEPYEGRFPIYDPDYMWGGTVYDKGSWILHMLRDVIGQADFVATMQLYADRFRYGAARTEDFIAAAEDASGEDLGWFFDEWVYKAGYPEIEYEWTYAGGTASVTVRQVQEVDSITPLFNMPLDIALITPAGTVETTVTMDQASETFPVAVPSAPIRVILDPHLVLLCKIYGPDGLVAGPGPDDSNPCAVRTFDGWAAPLGPEIVPYGVDRWGAKVGGGDLDGDGVDEVLTGPGPGAMFGPHVRGFEVAGSPLPGLSFLAYGTHKYGVNVTAGNLDGDARDEIITGAGPGAVFGPHVRAWNYSGSAVTPMPGVSFLAYGTHKWGVNVAAGDIDGDGYDEIVTGAGPGAVFGPHVRGWNVDGGAATAIPAVSFLAYGTHRWGVNVACGDLDADGMDEIITAPGPGEEFAPHIRAFNYDGVAITPMPEVNFFGFGYGYGAQVAAADLNGDRADDLIVAAGPAPQAPPYALTFTLNAEGEIELIFYIEAFQDTSRGLNLAGLRSVVGQ